MKKLTILMLTAVTLASLIGCSWPRWMCRGDACNTMSGACSEGGYSSPALMSPYIAPSELPSQLPGPGPMTLPSS
jgi:hypothetical protein